MKLTLTVNGSTHDVDVEPETPLLWVLRDTIGLTGTKYGCGIAQCGACTVHVDGQPAKACNINAASVGRSQDHHDRGPVHGQQPPRPEGLDRAHRAAMRLLPVRPDHGRGRAAAAHAQPDRQPDRRGDGRQPVPLRHLHPDSRGDPRRREDRAREGEISHDHNTAFTSGFHQHGRRGRRRPDARLQHSLLLGGRGGDRQRRGHGRILPAGSRSTPGSPSTRRAW